MGGDYERGGSRRCEMFIEIRNVNDARSASSKTTVYVNA
jgi:hypothetical protein